MLTPPDVMTYHEAVKAYERYSRLVKPLPDMPRGCFYSLISAAFVKESADCQLVYIGHAEKFNPTSGCLAPAYRRHGRMKGRVLSSEEEVEPNTPTRLGPLSAFDRTPRPTLRLMPSATESSVAKMTGPW